jgi:large conductance mechanosensitive channel
MIRLYSKSLRDFIMRGDAISIAAAFLMAMAVYFFLQTLVEGLVAPAIAALLGKADIYLLSFRINGSDFRYGSVLIGLIVLALVFVVVAVVGKTRQGAESRSNET